APCPLPRVPRQAGKASSLVAHGQRRSAQGRGGAGRKAMRHRARASGGSPPPVWRTGPLARRVSPSAESSQERRDSSRLRRREGPLRLRERRCRLPSALDDDLLPTCNGRSGSWVVLQVLGSTLAQLGAAEGDSLASASHSS